MTDYTYEVPGIGGFATHHDDGSSSFTYEVPFWGGYKTINSDGSSAYTFEVPGIGGYATIRKQSPQKLMDGLRELEDAREARERARKREAEDRYEYLMSVIEEDIAEEDEDLFRDHYGDGDDDDDDFDYPGRYDLDDDY